MSKGVKIFLVIAVVAIIGYVLYKKHKAKKAAEQAIAGNSTASVKDVDGEKEPYSVSAVEPVIVEDEPIMAVRG